MTQQRLPSSKHSPFSDIKQLRKVTSNRIFAIHSDPVTPSPDVKDSVSFVVCREGIYQAKSAMPSTLTMPAGHSFRAAIKKPQANCPAAH